MVLAILCINLTAFAQNINLKLNNVTVKKAMETLKEGNGYSFVFASGDVDTQKVIQVDVQNGTVDQVIKQILHGQKFHMRSRIRISSFRKTYFLINRKLRKENNRNGHRFRRSTYHRS